MRDDSVLQESAILAELWGKVAEDVKKAPGFYLLSESTRAEYDDPNYATKYIAWTNDIMGLMVVMQEAALETNDFSQFMQIERMLNFIFHQRLAFIGIMTDAWATYIGIPDDGRPQWYEQLKQLGTDTEITDALYHGLEELGWEGSWARPEAG